MAHNLFSHTDLEPNSVWHVLIGFNQYGFDIVAIDARLKPIPGILYNSIPLKLYKSRHH